MFRHIIDFPNFLGNTVVVMNIRYQPAMFLNCLGILFDALIFIEESERLLHVYKKKVRVIVNVAEWPLRLRNVVLKYESRGVR